MQMPLGIRGGRYGAQGPVVSLCHFSQASYHDRSSRHPFCQIGSLNVNCAKTTAPVPVTLDNHDNHDNTMLLFGKHPS